MAGKNIFNAIKLSRPKRSGFDLTHDFKFSCNQGELIPCLVMEVVPTDVVNIGGDALSRFQALVAPVMHRNDASIHYFFVPNRILWDNWEKYLNGDPSNPAFPTMIMQFDTYTRLCNYLGVPTPHDANSEVVSAMPFAAFQCVVNEYYRDNNLINPINYKLVNGDNTVNTELTSMRIRAWEKDYFTSALPFAQAGDPVAIPLGQTEDTPVKFNGTVAGNQVEWDATFDTPPSPIDVRVPAEPADVSVASDLYAEGANVEATTINDLRRAFSVQRFLEKLARGGKRLVEMIYAQFGYKGQDSRYQRPEYITGTKSPFAISEVLNTTGTEDAPQGNMAGHGVGVTTGKFGKFFVPEHGYIIGVYSVLPKPAYQQGIPKHFLKFNDKYDYAWPDFVNIGEQAILNKEIYAFQGVGGNDTFGYTPRYAEYRFMENRVAGDMQTTLDFWHQGRIFAGPVALNQSFIECVPDTRIFAVEEDAQHVIVHLVNKIKAVRPLPKFGTPI